MTTAQVKTKNERWYEEKEVKGRSGIRMPLLHIPVGEAAESVYLPLHPYLGFDQQERPEGKLAFFLSRNPFPEFSYYRPYLEKAWLKLKLRLDIPASVKENYQLLDEAEPLFLRKATLELRNVKTDAVLASEEKMGVAPSFELEMVLSPDDSDELVHALEGSASSLWVESCFVFSLPHQPEILKTIRSHFPLRQLLMTDAPSQEFNWKSCYERFFFDLSSGSYQRLPGIKQHLQARTSLPNKPVMVLAGASAMSMNQALRPSDGMAAHPLLNSHLSSLSAANLYKIDSLLIQALNGTKPQSLPIVDHEDKDFWKDRNDEKLFWCVPAFRLLRPEGQEPPEQSPFRFLFRAIGQDTAGQPVLEGEIKISIEKYLSSQLKEEVEKAGSNIKHQLLGGEGLSIQLEIPFRHVDGKAMTSLIQAHEIEQDGNRISCIFRLSNQWIRVCYGAASVEAFQQDRPLRLWVAYTFKGYVPVKQQSFDWLATNKISALPLMKGRSSRQKNYFNGKDQSLVLENGQKIAFTDSPLSPAGQSRNMQVLAAQAALQKPSLSNVAITALNPALNKIEVNKIHQADTYSTQHFGKKESLDILFRCEDFGNYYQEMEGEEFRAIGCKEPYRLGQVDFKLYEPIPALNHGLYKVHRSTQSPGTFLVVPTRYIITRFEAGKQEQAFKACIKMYSTIDVENLHHSNCVFDASLEPDMPPVVQKELLLALKKYTPYEPLIEYISEINSEASYMLPDLSSVIQSLKCFSVGRVLRLSIASRIDGVLTLQSLLKSSAFTGKAVFKLPDGTAYESLLEPSLSMVGGCWTSGPFEIVRHDQVLRLSNRIERAVNLVELKLFDDQKLHKTVALNQKLQPGEQVEVVEAERGLTAIPVYTVEPGTISLEEERNYMEDIQCQLIFLTTVPFDQLQLAEITVEARLPASEHAEKNVLSKDQPTIEMMLLMPLTTFVSERRVEFRTAIKKTGQAAGQPSDWQAWSLATSGNIINITSSHLSLS